MPDVAIINQAVASAPKDYLLTGTQEIRPKAVRAIIDGSGAAATYRPALQLLAPDGTVMWTAISMTSVAAGASANVTWFPGLGSGSGVTQTLVGARIQATSGQSIANATNVDLQYQQVYFDTDGMANLGSDNRILTVNTGGVYLVTVATAWDYLANAEGRRINVVLQNGFYSSGGVPNQFSVVDERMPIWATSGITPPAPRTTNLVLGIFSAAVGDFFSSGVYQASGGAATANGYEFCFLSAVLIGAS